MRKVYIVHLASRDLGVARLVLPLGPLAVASAVRRSPRFGTEDRVLICDSFREVRAALRRHRRERVFYLASSAQLLRGVEASENHAVACARRVREIHPAVTCCVGGPDVALDRAGYEAHFDLVFEGEIGAVDLLEVLHSGAPRFAAPRPADLNAEALDYGLLRGRKYLAGALQASRGCPFDCSFCNIGHLSGPGARVLAPELLAERLESLALVHRGLVILGDDNFAGGTPSGMLAALEVIVRFQERHGYPFAFAVQVSLNVAGRPDVVAGLRRANVTAAFIGVESPSAGTLAAHDKRHNLQGPIPEQVAVFTRNGIVPYLSFILGLDGEPPDVARRIRDLLDSCRTPFVQVNLVNPVVGSRFRAEAGAAGRLLEDPLYRRHHLMPLRTARPYAEVVRDYAGLLDWFHAPRRLFRYCANVEGRRRAVHDPRTNGAWAAQVAPARLARLLALYLLLCLKCGAPGGLLRALALAGRPRAEVFDVLLLRGVAVALRGQMRRESRLVRRGIRRLRAAGRYPYDRPGSGGR